MKLIHRHNEEIDELQKLTRELEKSPAFKELRKEQAAETLVERKDAAGKIKALEKEQGEVIPKLREDLAKAERNMSMKMRHTIQEIKL